MKIHFFTIFLALIGCLLNAQLEEKAIRASLQGYIDGSSYNDPEKIVAPFYEDARMFLSKKDQPIYILSPAAYAALFEKREKGVFNGRVGTILGIDQQHDIATAKVEILMAKEKLRFIDLFLLKKMQGEWKIISKAATLMPDKD
ncbi:nuclear transport factor 2 family protein [Flavobacteriaceae bacterium TP-CH-4]|uniref:Nuclear transport factor 2 family protein n=1 Tax=Pelagihabitans pacificus TaxID=2696054 RepID=A0A967AW63_9FLAO|nr:nuclear transport factor 2 family protein [Pelagihabitans pacificus]NHF60485.1 nuclear transport factor 2 family protein [Pelagihabitans pacificus]